MNRAEQYFHAVKFLNMIINTFKLVVKAVPLYLKLDYRVGKMEFDYKNTLTWSLIHFLNNFVYINISQIDF